MNIKRKMIERVRITGPSYERPMMYDWLEKYGFRLKHSGPIFVGQLKVDTTRFGVTGEREVKKRPEATIESDT